MIKQYKPNDSARIEAMLFTEETVAEAILWVGEDIRSVTWRGYPTDCYEIRTLEGEIDLPYGHYLAKGTHGEFYPIDPDVFEKRWVEV